jgi:hypothetical protein
MEGRLKVKVGEANSKGQTLVRMTREKSRTHDFARVWVMRCGKCGSEYGSNSCDAHIRNCPDCSGGRPGEPILSN